MGLRLQGETQQKVESPTDSQAGRGLQGPRGGSSTHKQRLWAIHIPQTEPASPPSFAPPDTKLLAVDRQPLSDLQCLSAIP
ncbi:hypothetical protein P7K49_019481 [Saguinus oedipus]|uniref:Uncharacterized protein n=1 Tax=Saguinus oedipus TaxID=9490 RepID=A0ABQ9UYA7_SAGOE|nr:hypothetical protein P7K49_019481 [Saguinus oedipus]